MDDKKVYNYTKKTGRPPKYEGDKTVDKVYEYINSCIDEIEIFDKTVGDKSNSYERVLKTKIPTLAGLALYLEVNKATVYEWGKEYKEFSNALDDLTSLQEEKLLNGGVSGTYNSTISKLILSSNHGYKEKTEENLNVNGNLQITGMKIIEDNG